MYNSKYYENLRKECCEGMGEEIKKYINNLSIEELEEYYFENIEYLKEE